MKTKNTNDFYENFYAVILRSEADENRYTTGDRRWKMKLNTAYELSKGTAEHNVILINPNLDGYVPIDQRDRPMEEITEEFCHGPSLRKEIKSSTFIQTPYDIVLHYCEAYFNSTAMGGDVIFISKDKIALHDEITIETFPEYFI